MNGDPALDAPPRAAIRKPRVLAFAGSLRRESYNKKLIRTAAEAVRRQGAEVDLLELNEVVMPLYDGDLEEAQGLPPGVVAFKRRLAWADGFLIASPEYNHSIPGPLKNAIDWASRGEEDVFDGKLGALLAASPGGFGGVRMIPHLRQVLTGLGVWLVPNQVTVSKAHEAFGPDGTLSSDWVAKQVEDLAQVFVSNLKLHLQGTLQVSFLPDAKDWETPARR